MPDVRLIFPPLVSSGFGRYYPASAVLAGYLARHGIAARQSDLNTELALHLTDPVMLAEIGRGRLFSDGPPIEPAAMPAVAARCLARNRDELFDRDGRYDFARPDGPGFLLHELAKPLSIDCSIADLIAPSDALAWQLPFYERFYASRAICAADDPSVALFGVTVAMGPQLAPACVLAAHLRRLRPEARIVFGGPALSLLDEDDLERLLVHFPAIDAIVRFDGEAPLLALVQQARAGLWEPWTAGGTSALGPAGIVHGPLVAGPSLHTLPSAAYDPALVREMRAPELGIVQARGCYWGECSYCDFVELYGASRPFRSRTAVAVVDEIERQRAATGASRFTLITEAIPPGFARRFAALAVERGLEIRWNSFAMVDHRFTPADFEAMTRSGCEHLTIGLETMTDRVLGLVRKAATRETNIAFLRDASAAGIALYVNLIPDLPSTTLAESMETLAIMREVADCLAYVSVFPFEATRSSQVGRDPAAFGLVSGTPPATTGQAEFTANHLGAVDPAMTDAERRTAVAAYRAFAAAVNAARATPNPPAQATRPREAGAPALYRVALSDIDIAVAADSAQLFNWRRHSGWTGPRGIAALAAKLGEDPFDRDRFTTLAGSEAVAAVLWSSLTRMGAIEEVV